MRTTMMSAALLAAAATGAIAGGPNLATNGSFETPGPGFVLFQGWENYGNVFDDGAIDVGAHDGNVAVKMFGGFPGPGIQSDQVLLQTVTGITPGTTYTLSAQLQQNSADLLGSGNLILLQMVFQNSSGGNIEVLDQPVLEAGSALDTWIQYDITGIAPPNTDRILIALLHLQLDGTSAGASFWDSIVLTEGAAGCSNPADFNGDGVLNFFDISSFISAFQQGCNP